MRRNKMRNRTKRRMKLALILLIPIAVGLYFYIYTASDSLTGFSIKDIKVPEQEKEKYEVVTKISDENPLSLEGYSEVKVSTIPGNVILAKNCTGLVLFTTRAKSFSINRGIQSTLELRPNEHDVIEDIISNFNIDVIFAKLHRIESNFYYARLFLKRDNEIIALDTKPTDAISVATRFNAPIYIKNDLLEKYGVNVCKIPPPPQEKQE